MRISCVLFHSTLISSIIFPQSPLHFPLQLHVLFLCFFEQRHWVYVVLPIGAWRMIICQSICGPSGLQPWRKGNHLLQPSIANSPSDGVGHHKNLPIYGRELATCEALSCPINVASWSWYLIVTGRATSEIQLMFLDTWSSLSAFGISPAVPRR